MDGGGTFKDGMVQWTTLHSGYGRKELTQDAAWKEASGVSADGTRGEESMEAGELAMWGQGGPCRISTFHLRAAEAIKIFSV